MAQIAGIFQAGDGLPKDGATVKLWASSRFASPPEKDTALPSGDPTDETETGEEHGGNGQYRFTGVNTGTWYVSVEWNGSIIYDSFDVVAAPFVDVTDYGAVGDGVTDDTTAINNCLADATVGFVLFPPGTYLVTGLAIASRTGLTLEGQGATIKLSGTGTSANPRGLALTGTCRDINIRNLRFLGDGTANNYHVGIEIGAGPVIEGLRVENCHFETLVCGWWQVMGSGRVTRSVIANCEFEDCHGTGTSQGRGIFINQVNSEPMGLVVTNCDFDDTDLYAIQIISAYDTIIKGCTFRNHRNALGDATHKPVVLIQGGENHRIQGNDFHSYSDGGVWIEPIATTIKRVSILDNTFFDPATARPAITIGGDDPANDGTVENCVIRGNQLYQSNITIQGILIQSGLYVTIEGNILQIEDLAGTTYAIDLAALGESGATSTYTDEVHVRGNQAIFTLSGGTGYGIRLRSAFCASTIAAYFSGCGFPGAASNFLSDASIADDNIIVFGMSTSGLSFNASSTQVELDAGPLDLNAYLRFGTPKRISASTTIRPFEPYVVVTTGASNCVVTIPAIGASGSASTVADGHIIILVKTDSGAGRVEITTDGFEEIVWSGGSTIPVLTRRFDTIMLISDNTNNCWYAIGSFGVQFPKKYKMLATADTPYAMTLSDETLYTDTSGGNLEIDLVSVVNNDGRRLRIFRLSGSNTLTLDPNGTEQINGAGAGTAVTLNAAADNWWEYEVINGEWKLVAGGNPA